MTKYKNTFHTGCIFKITLHQKDTVILEGLYKYFSNYWRVREKNISFYKYNSRTNKVISISKQNVSLTISNINDIGNIIIPFFELYPILGHNKMDFNDFKIIYNFIISKGHLNPEGLAKIQQIGNNMNDKRTVV